MPITLNRTTFTTSRLLEYFGEAELAMQLGAGRQGWPLALARELIDNALDACEAVGTAPVITLSVEPGALTVADNGPGLPLATIEGALNYSVRVSDKSGYVSPTRSRLGNALKCVFAAPFVASGGHHGRVIVATNGARHTIDIGLDQVRQEPRVSVETVADPTVQIGTAITLVWPELASLPPGDADRDLYRESIRLLEDYRLFNPHATFRLRAPAAGGVP